MESVVVTVEVIAGSNSSLQANHWALVVIALEVVNGVVVVLWVEWLLLLLLLLPCWWG